jgi:hypothetical protein
MAGGSTRRKVRVDGLRERGELAVSDPPLPPLSVSLPPSPSKTLFSLPPVTWSSWAEPTRFSTSMTESLPPGAVTLPNAVELRSATIGPLSFA